MTGARSSATSTSTGSRVESHRVHHVDGDGARLLAPSAAASAPVGATPERRSFAGRVEAVVIAAWGAVTGVAPHVLHHVGPLAGAAFLAGAGGRLLFAAIAFVVSIPFLLRIRRRFRTWLAPAIALLVMVATFSLSTFVIGPAISGESSKSPSPVEQPTVDEHGH